MKNRFFLFGIVLVLSSCSPRAGALDPEEVLRRTAGANRTLESVAFSGTANITMKMPKPSFGLSRTIEANVMVDGLMTDAGKQMKLAVELDSEVEEAEVTYDIEGDVDIILLWGSDTYLRLRQWTVNPPYPMVSSSTLDAFSGSWWQLPSKPTNKSTTITPDPSLLKMQSEVLTVMSDEGMTQMDDRDVYHYKVGIDKLKMLTFLERAAGEHQEEFERVAAEDFLAQFDAAGEIWIDAETFFVRRLSWEITPKAEEGVRLSLDLTFTDHNSALTIEPPLDARPFTPDVLLPVNPQNPATLTP